MKILIYFYIIFNDVDGYIIECNGYKYLIFASIGKNKKVLKKYTKLWDKIRNQIKTLNSGKPIKFKKDFMGLRLNQMMIYLWVKY